MGLAHGWARGRASRLEFWARGGPGPQLPLVQCCCPPSPSHRALASNVLFTNLNMGAAHGSKRGFFDQGPGGSGINAGL